jgi:hypothetical protein
MRIGKTLLLIAAAVLATSAAQAGWQDQVSATDANRLAKLDEAKAKALSEASGGGDMGTIHEVLDPQAVSVSGDALKGSWRCRTIKIGGMTPDVVYSWFHCRIRENGDGLAFEKISGSQHLAGELYPNESGGYVLLGAFSMKGEKAHIYSGNGASAGAMATPDDAVGVFEATGPRSARIEFPYPVQESTFDVIELKR